MTPEAPRKQVVFISYSREDARWLGRLLVHLAPLRLEYPVEIWSDVNIEAGERWRQKITDALDAATVFVLLLSADFVASDFVTNVELPRLLKAAKDGEADVLPVAVRECRLPAVNDLPEYQAINDPETPVADLPESRQEAVFKNVAVRIAAILEKGVARDEPAAAAGEPAPPALVPRPRRKPGGDCRRYVQTFGLHIKHLNSVIRLNYALIMSAAVIWLAVVMAVFFLGQDLGIPRPVAAGVVVPFIGLAFHFLRRVTDIRLSVDKCEAMKSAFDSECPTWSSFEYEEYKREADNLLRAVAGVHDGRQRA